MLFISHKRNRTTEGLIITIYLLRNDIIAVTITKLPIKISRINIIFMLMDCARSAIYGCGYIYEWLQQLLWTRLQLQLLYVTQ